MAPPKQYRPQSTPTKPQPKRSKLTSETPAAEQVRGQVSVNNESNMATSSTARRSLNSTEGFATDGPPQWFLDFEKRLDERLEHLLTTKIEALTAAVNDHDERFNKVDFDIEEIKTDVRKLRDEKDILLNKIDDLENRSRRNNLVIYGVPEVSQAQEDCNKTVNELFEFVGLDNIENIWESVSRCHRTPTRKPQDLQDTKPRMIHIGFASFNVREKVRKACLAKFKTSEYKGRKIFVSDDLSKRVLQQRKVKMPVFQKLKKEGKKPFFTYPANLKYRDDKGVIVNVDLQQVFTGLK